MRRGDDGQVRGRTVRASRTTPGGRTCASCRARCWVLTAERRVDEDGAHHALSAEARLSLSIQRTVSAQKMDAEHLKSSRKPAGRSPPTSKGRRWAGRPTRRGRRAEIFGVRIDKSPDVIWPRCEISEPQSRLVRARPAPLDRPAAARHRGRAGRMSCSAGASPTVPEAAVTGHLIELLAIEEPAGRATWAFAGDDVVTSASAGRGGDDTFYISYSGHGAQYIDACAASQGADGYRRRRRQFLFDDEVQGGEPQIQAFRISSLGLRNQASAPAPRSLRGNRNQWIDEAAFVKPRRAAKGRAGVTISGRGGGDLVAQQRQTPSTS